MHMVPVIKLFLALLQPTLLLLEFSLQLVPIVIESLPFTR